MAYYTIAHLLQGGSLDGSEGSPSNIKPEQMTEAVWDYIYLKQDYPADCGISEEILSKMRREFEYWYPFDLRCSGKDLIGNHLTMALYNHAAIWEDKEKMPKSYFCNGWMMLNDKPMSKSAGNFISLKDCIGKYGADATRLTFADAGDTLDDGNFREANANAAIMKLFNLGQWIESELAKIDPKTVVPANYMESLDTYDRMFDNECNRLLESAKGFMEEMKFKLALRDAFYELTNMRDEYIQMKSNKLNPLMVLRYIHIQILMLTPFVPHFTDFYWKNHFLTFYEKVEKAQELNFKASIINSPWPVQSRDYDQSESQRFGFLKFVKKMISDSSKKFNKKGKGKKGKKGKQPKEEEKKEEKKEEAPVKVAVFFAKKYPDWQENVLKAL